MCCWSLSCILHINISYRLQRQKLEPLNLYLINYCYALAYVRALSLQIFFLLWVTGAVTLVWSIVEGYALQIDFQESIKWFSAFIQKIFTYLYCFTARSLHPFLFGAWSILQKEYLISKFCWQLEATCSSPHLANLGLWSHIFGIWLKFKQFSQNSDFGTYDLTEINKLKKHTLSGSNPEVFLGLQ